MSELLTGIGELLTNDPERPKITDAAVTFIVCGQMADEHTLPDRLAQAQYLETDHRRLTIRESRELMQCGTHHSLNNMLGQIGDMCKTSDSRKIFPLI